MPLPLPAALSHVPVLRVCLAGLLLSVLALLVLQQPSQAQAQAGTVIYRCTDAQGAVTVQNGTACPKGSRQERRVITPAASFPAFSTPPPAPVAREPAPAPVAATPPARPEIPAPEAIADIDRLPPPPIFKCVTWDNDSYLSENPEPKPRCVQLDTGGVGQACEMKYDQCARVPDGAACAGWTQRQREIESSWRHAEGVDKPPLQDAFARVSRILNDTTCAL